MIQYFFRKWTVNFSTEYGKESLKMKRLFLAFAAIAAAALIFAGCSDEKNKNTSDENSSVETSQSVTASESTTEETERETSLTTTKKSTQSTPIPTQATLKTTARTSSTTTVTTTTESTTTENAATASSQPNVTSFSMTEGEFSVILNGKRVALGMRIAGRINEFGTLQATVSRTGDTAIYSYKDCKITAQSGYVKQISVTGESVSTDTGITIGASKEEVISKYKNAAYSENAVYASSGASAVQFNIENDSVTMITLSAS